MARNRIKFVYHPRTKEIDVEKLKPIKRKIIEFLVEKASKS
ncbi:MAG: hypothetical protein Q8935_10290 [Bacillota bacterium]|nr:hypothetical protein [Bacillota bacterium]